MNSRGQSHPVHFAPHRRRDRLFIRGPSTSAKSLEDAFTSRAVGPNGRLGEGSSDWADMSFFSPRRARCSLLRVNRAVGMNMADSDIPKLIRPFEAFKLLRDLYGGGTNAKKLIADKIRDGEIVAFAKRTWVSREPSLVTARNAKPPKNAGKFAQIKRSKLIAAARWTEEAPNWKWRQSVFHTVSTTDPVKRRIFTGVRLVEDDVLRLLVEAQTARQKDASNAGAKRNSDSWDDLWLTALDVVTKDPFNRSNPGSQQKLIHAIFAQYAADKRAPLPSDTAVKKAVSKIYARLLSGIVD